MEGPWQRWSKGEHVDRWTYTHVLWGIVAKRMGVTATELLSLSVANEAVEAWIRQNKPAMLFGSPEQPGNIVVDVVVTMAAFHLTPGARR
jgi:hypothetical protein